MVIHYPTIYPQNLEQKEPHAQDGGSLVNFICDMATVELLSLTLFHALHYAMTYGIATHIIMTCNLVAVFVLVSLYRQTRNSTKNIRCSQ